MSVSFQRNRFRLAPLLQAIRSHVLLNYRQVVFVGQPVVVEVVPTRSAAIQGGEVPPPLNVEAKDGLVLITIARARNLGSQRRLQVRQELIVVG